MTAEITMPQLGETVTEGTITRWAKKVGDRVEEDEILFEVSTDKVDSEVPSPAAGYLAEILVQEGETADVGARLAVITEESPDGGGKPAATDEAASADGKPAQPTAEEEAPGSEKPAQEPAPQKAKAGGKAGKDQEKTAQPAEQPQPQPETAPSPEPPAATGDGSKGGGSSNAKLLSPIVRRLIAEHGLDPEEIHGSGAGGRISRTDVLAAIDARAAAGGSTSAPRAEEPRAAPAGARATANGDTAADTRAADSAPRDRGDQVVPFSNIRRRTAEHMRRSLDTSAHTLVVGEVDYQNVETVRLPARERFKAAEGVSLSYLPFIARAVLDAIHEFPHVNASVGDNELIIHRDVHLGIAVDLNHEGLIVPVVHGADAKRLRALAREIADLAGRARARKLSADDISGGTFTITNPGGYGTLLTAPIINQPQVAILSTDGVKQKPVAVPVPGGGYAVAVHPVGNLAISFDHRAFDGAYASAFLARIRETLETRDWSLELA